MSLEIIWIYIYEKIFDKISKICHFFTKNPSTPLTKDSTKKLQKNSFFLLKKTKKVFDF